MSQQSGRLDLDLGCSDSGIFVLVGGGGLGEGDWPLKPLSFLSPPYKQKGLCREGEDPNKQLSLGHPLMRVMGNMNQKFQSSSYSANKDT